MPILLDPNYKVPKGFEPHLNYPDGKTGVPVVGLAVLNFEGVEYHFQDIEDLLFNIEEKVPALPLKRYAKLWHKGWDIPDYYAIDASGQCWGALGGHGSVLYPVTPEELLNITDSDNDKTLICQVLSREPPMLDWQKKALAAGWTPPAKK
jgi:hypothetical protein